MTWQPISTAPMDGTRILLFDPPIRGVDPGAVLIGSYFLDDWNVDDGTRCDPTHWMPLPAPPEDGEPGW